MAVNVRNLKYGIESIKSTFSKVSMNNQFKVTFGRPPSGLSTYLNGAGLRSTSDGIKFLEKTELLCNATSLPGSALQLFPVNTDYQGMIENFPKARIYGDSNNIGLSFYVDADHQVIRFFEEWINYINPLISPSGLVRSSSSGQDTNTALKSSNINRMRYPETYRMNFALTKFERNVGYSDIKNTKSDYLTYEFVDAFPVNISRMPVQYGQANILTLNVTMNYLRYITRNKTNFS